MIVAVDVILAVNVNLVAVIMIVAAIIIIIVAVMAADLADLAVDLVAAVVAVGFGFYSFYSLVEEEVAEDFSSNLINLKENNWKVALALDSRNAKNSVSIILHIKVKLGI